MYPNRLECSGHENGSFMLLSIVHLLDSARASQSDAERDVLFIHGHLKPEQTKTFFVQVDITKEAIMIYFTIRVLVNALALAITIILLPGLHVEPIIQGVIGGVLGARVTQIATYVIGFFAGGFYRFVVL